MTPSAVHQPQPLRPTSRPDTMPKANLPSHWEHLQDASSTSSRPRLRSPQHCRFCHRHTAPTSPPLRAHQAAAPRERRPPRIQCAGTSNWKVQTGSALQCRQAATNPAPSPRQHPIAHKRRHHRQTPDRTNKAPWDWQSSPGAQHRPRHAPDPQHQGIPR